MNADKISIKKSFIKINLERARQGIADPSALLKSYIIKNYVCKRKEACS